MIRCENLTKEDLKRIGTQVGDAFLSQPGAFRALSADQAQRLFALMVRMGYQCGNLYTTGENQEASAFTGPKSSGPACGCS